ncbi:GNAT family N-acetyltransferase [Streptomyces harbinensis]|uniref:GNAT family N-acetyltransferase n=1 Tax=Streptomyces harbinensis TaxID=1176198 RepID=UPI0033962AC7
MTGTGTASADWPPAPLRTGRLVLRAAEGRDRAAFIALFASPEVTAYTGGPRPRAELERAVPEAPGQRPRCFVAELDGTMIGMVTLDERNPERPGPARPDAGRVELGYLFLPDTWGHGYAAEACTAVLGWYAAAHPGEPVALCTRTDNGRALRLAAKLGFTEVERYAAYGAEQWLGVWHPVPPAG